MDSSQREALFSMFLALLFTAIAVFLDLFGLGQEPFYAFLALFSTAFLGYLISLKGGTVGLKPVHSILFLLAAFFAAAIKTGLGFMLIPTLAFPVAAVLLLSFLGPVRASLFGKKG
jgi:hypothetical protein